MSLTARRKPEWNSAPTPRILNLPRRIRRRRICRTAVGSYGGRPVIGRDAEGRQWREDCRGKVDSLVERNVERKSADNFVDAREREINGGGFMEEKWRFQTEILRAECNFLRMEREIALKKMERNRTQMEITLRSAVDGLVSGRNKIHEGKNINDVFDEEIEYLEEMLGELQRGSYAAKDIKVKKCSNFDRKTSLLRRRLESLGKPTTGENESASNDPPPENPNSVMTLWEKDSCSGRCKSIVKRIVEQVRSERDQWSQMQEMVGRVRDEMEELQACREFWEDRAMDSEFESRSLRILVQEWRQKAMSFEAKAKDLETEVYSLKLKKEEERRNQLRVADISTEKKKKKLALNRGLKKENPGNGSIGVPRSPFRDIGNTL